ncbi:glycosyltransferase family 2 protein [Acinetobacter chinensis]|uniref:glycosyltransferase family 2 protein n=1 Tax=Acinetobacter chinensis TaxID=2004650 RepID=UPI00293433F0|nr:glycosyltransferase family 2 protein [Acinetobacter chinensis]WOE41341.1 glycosyltransferase family 2 protein [Acinetobacter chinensis]
MNIIASIVIYRHSYTDLKPTLDSLFLSPFISKIILVDNALSDWAENFKHEKIIYLKTNGNYGFGYGHNYAIKKYSKNSDYFLICNPDIWFEQKEFENFINFVKDRDESLFIPKVIYPDGENQYGARLLPSPVNLFARRFTSKFADKLDQEYLLKNFDLNKEIFAPSISGCFMLFRSSTLIKLGGFDERFFLYMEDIDLSRRCAEKYGAVYYPLAQIIHKHNQESYTNSSLLKIHLKSAFLYFNKWGWFYDSDRKKLNNRCLNQYSHKLT